ncbi:prepilin-type N-terminal cleavage/methylation domain-containing protein [Deinococcus sp. 12RED42]|uniref:prepilin-type N-terminal cleavage/methylation domain-containing protein n=1 Tax=Deinococcus sp. 12RED42 TaxID=2745872 RepID=UPI001E456989|nr:prepilin-type N-terminal cleavage/methylation domain-containing protein [Deinococcus sp. 12RED42]MCD0164809.1 prepilin-type N-terminal cleavage/methylation domain-containing protein [Deinococcus sp. 12RED42]
MRDGFINNGFTLIEILIAILILSILAGFMIPAIIGSQKRSYDIGAQSCAKSIETVQGISQIDNRSYLKVGSGASQINKNTDGVSASCKIPSVFIKDRSSPSSIIDDYSIDVWDSRGSKVFTITPSYLKSNAPGATPFSTDGSGGSNLP